MVSNFPRWFASPDELVSHPAQTPQVDGFGERVLDRVREAFCGLHGHDSLLQFQQDRLFLKCVSCGHESPGWDLNEPRPTVVAGVKESRPVVESPLLDERRIA